MYDITTLFNAGSTKTNGRYMYQALDATMVGRQMIYGCLQEQEIMKE